MRRRRERLRAPSTSERHVVRRFRRVSAPARLTGRRFGGMGTPPGSRYTAGAGGGLRIVASLRLFRRDTGGGCAASSLINGSGCAAASIGGTDWAMPALAPALMELLDRGWELRRVVVDADDGGVAGATGYPVALLRQIPIGRVGAAEDVAAVYVFLASDRATYRRHRHQRQRRTVAPLAPVRATMLVTPWQAGPWCLPAGEHRIAANCHASSSRSMPYDERYEREVIDRSRRRKAGMHAFACG